MVASSDDIGAARPRPGGFIGPFTRRQLAAALSAAAVVGLLLVLVTRPLIGDPTANQQTGPGTSFVVIGNQTQGLSPGQQAPDFAAADGSARVTDLDGNPLTIADLRGRPVWVIFWATWCPPCQAETPDIQRIWEEYRDDGLAIVAVDVQEPAEAVADYARTYGLTYPIGVDVTAEVMKAYAVFGLPTHYFIGREGTVRDRYFGPLQLDQMRERIEAIMSDAP